MNKVYLLLGSNQQNPFRQIKQAQKYIGQQIGLITRQSALYVTAAWGNTNQPDFLNQVIIIETLLPAQKLIEQILFIEKKMGRIRKKKNAPRIIDIDILFYNKSIVDLPYLNIPHPQIQNRRFVLVPLKELSPNLKHPILKKSIHQLLQLCTDTLDVKKFYP